MRVTLHCTDVNVTFARDAKDAHIFRQEIDERTIDLECLPNKGETLSLFTKSGWVEFVVGCRGISYCFADAAVRAELMEKAEYGLWAEKLVIMQHNEENNG